jgi:hypothetical protein
MGGWRLVQCLPSVVLFIHSSSRGRILRQNPDKSLAIHIHLYCGVQLYLRFNFFKLTQPLTYPPSLWVKKSIHLNLKSENFEDYAQKPLRNFRFMNSASGVFKTTSVCTVYAMWEIRLQYKKRCRKIKSTPSKYFNGMGRKKIWR